MYTVLIKSLNALSCLMDWPAGYSGIHNLYSKDTISANTLSILRCKISDEEIHELYVCIWYSVALSQEMDTAINVSHSVQLLNIKKTTFIYFRVFRFENDLEQLPTWPCIHISIRHSPTLLIDLINVLLWVYILIHRVYTECLPSVFQLITSVFGCQVELIYRYGSIFPNHVH